MWSSFSRAGLAVDAAASGARGVGTNGADRFVSPAGFRLRRQGWENRGEMAGRAYGKTVWSWPSLLRSSLCEYGIRVNRRGVGDFRWGEGGQRELGSRESTA